MVSKEATNPKRKLSSGLDMNEFLSRLVPYDLKQVGSNRYVARCPAHHEKTPSLSITVMDDGKTVAYCFGCGADGIGIVESLGLKPSDLFPEGDDFNREEYKHKKQIQFQRKQFMEDYRLIKLGESDLAKGKKFNDHDRKVFKEAVQRVNQYRFDADEVYQREIEKDAMSAEFNRTYNEFKNKSFEEKYGVEYAN